MLILARRLYESVIINNNIKIIYLGLNERGQCKLGIEAPPEVSVYREEIQKKIDNESKQKDKLIQTFPFCHE